MRVVALACLALCGLAAPASAAVTLPEGFEQVDTTPRLVGSTTDAAFAPDGRIVTVEKNGRVRVTQNGTVRSVLDLSSRVNSYSDRGMLGVAVDKDFTTNGWVYLLYVAEHDPLNPDQPGATVSRLSRITLRPDNTVANATANPETIILGKSPDTVCPLSDNTNDCIPADFHWHNIGTVRVDPVDGTLWVGTGDASFSNQVQETAFRTFDENTYRGKILHIGKDGRGLPGHPFCPTDDNYDHVCTKVYAKGFRNPFRFSLRPGKGPVVGDVGASRWEEVDLVKPGGNYGWPCFEGNTQYSVYRSDARCQAEYAKTGSDRAVDPDYQYAHGTGASITGGPAYAGSGYPSSYRGDIFIADYVQGWIKRLEVDETGDRIVGEQPFATYDPVDTAPGFVDLIALPNGNVGYVDMGWNEPVFAGGIVREFRYTTGNRTPVARATGSPTSGPAPLTVAFDASTSSDPDGDALTYSWNFGDGSTGTGAKPSHTYTTAGTYTARVTVADGRGSSATADVGPITPGNTPPTARIDSPADGSKFRYGSPITLTGSGTDPQDGSVPSSRLTWTIRQEHGTHTHDFTSKTGSSVTLDPGADHDADSAFTITLTATDSQGSTGTHTIRIDPETVQLTLASSPAGAPVQYADTAATAPSTVSAAIGYQPTITAAESFEQNGFTYRFRRWADSATEPRQRVITVPATNTTYTAQYNGVPVANFSATPATGAAPLDVAFDASASIEPDAGDSLTYAWDFGDGTPAGTGRTPTHRYARPGSYTARLTVTDTHGATATTTRVIAATDSPPTAVTAGDSLFRSGSPITVTATATDAQDGTIAANTLDWKVFHHRGSNVPTQVHTVTNSGTAGYTPPATTDSDSYYMFHVTATDSAGNTSTTVRRVDPRLVGVTVNSSPTGAAVSFPAGNTTFPRSSVAGFTGTTAGPASFVKDGTTYNFRRWSDGNANASRAYSVPDADTATLTAEYNGVPTAGFTATPQTGTAPLDVAFDAGPSSDPEGATLTYAWEFGDGTTGTGRTTSHRYANPGSYTARLTVTDQHGATASATRTVTVADPSDSPPTATIDSPGAGERFDAGERIVLSGGGTDAQGPTTLEWRVLRWSGGTATPVATDGGAFTVPAEPAVDDWYEVELTATDSAGLVDADTRRVDPHTSNVRLTSEPDGIELRWRGAPLVTPATALSVVGSRSTVSAPAELSRDGRRWLFGSWSNGGDREHTVAVSAGDPELRARFSLQDAPLPQPESRPQPQPLPQPQPQPQPQPPLVELLLPRGGVKASRAGAAKIKLRNRNALASVGSLELATVKTIRAKARARPKRVKFAEAAFIVAPKATRTITVKLSKSNLKLLERLRRVQVLVAWEGRDRGGRKASGRSQTILLPARR